MATPTSAFAMRTFLSVRCGETWGGWLGITLGSFGRDGWTNERTIDSRSASRPANHVLVWEVCRRNDGRLETRSREIRHHRFGREPGRLGRSKWRVLCEVHDEEGSIRDE